MAQEVFLFSPTSVPGCQLWLDGADPNGNGSRPVNGSSLSTWSDKSGNGRNATAFSTAATFSNSNVVFTGNQMYNTTLTSVLNKQTMFAIASANSTNKMDIVGVQTTTVTTGIQLIVQNYSQVVTLFGGALVANGSAVIQNVRFIYGTIYNAGSDSFIYLNGTQSGTKSGSTTLTGSGTVTIGAYYYVGSDPTPSEWWIGNISEVIVYNDVLNTSQRQQIEGYLAWKWGLQGNLPSNHPFKTYRPIANPPIPTSVGPMPIVTQNVSVFLPTQISGCQLWVDAADVASMTFSSASNLQTWRNKATASGVFTRGGTADRLTYTSSNGYPLVSFNSDGSTSNAWMTGSVSLTANTSFLQVITPISYNVGTWGFYWSWQWNNAGDRVPGFRSSNVNNDFQPYITWVGNNNNRIAITPGTSYLSFVEFTGGGANTRYSINGNTPTGGAISASNINSSVFILGGDGNNGATVWGKNYLSEMIMYSNVLTTQQRQQVEGYLAWKWGFQTNLPSSHPYKTTPYVPFPSRFLPFNGSLGQWSPTQISGLRLWMDATDVNGTGVNPSSATITTWKDKSSSGLSLTSSTARTLNNNSLNGKAGVSFPSSGVGFRATITNTVSTPPLLIAGVCSYTVGTGANMLISCTGNDMNVCQITGSWQAYNTGGTIRSPNAITTGAQMISVIYDNILGGFWKNGSVEVVGSGGTGTQFSGTVGIGCYAGANDSIWSGDINEVIVFPSNSTAQRQQVEGYLAWKWGLQGSLPATHPYKKFPPSP